MTAATSLILEITDEDFPVNKSYIEQLKQLGVDIIGTSKWVNCALINPYSQDIITAIEQLEFVEKVVKVSHHFTDNSNLFSNEIYNKWNNIIYKSIESEPIPTDGKYGLGYDQINQINGIPIHKRGFTGQGVLIAVLDGGFSIPTN